LDKESELSSFKELIVWKKSMALVKQIYAITEKFPSKELYGLSSQLRRAAVSVPSNIAEGQSRFSKPEFKHFLLIARGSLAEIETQCILAHDLGFMSDKVSKSLHCKSMKSTRS